MKENIVFYSHNTVTAFVGGLYDSQGPYTGNEAHKGAHIICLYIYLPPTDNTDVSTKIAEEMNYCCY